MDTSLGGGTEGDRGAAERVPVIAAPRPGSPSATSAEDREALRLALLLLDQGEEAARRGRRRRRRRARVLPGISSRTPLSSSRACRSSTSQRGNAAAAASAIGITVSSCCSCSRVRAPSRPYGPTPGPPQRREVPADAEPGAQVAGEGADVRTGGADHRDDQVE